MPEHIIKKIAVRTTQEHLGQLGLTEADIEPIISEVASILGIKFTKIFGTQLNGNSIDVLCRLHPLLKTISECEGLDRLVKLIDKNNFEDHLFTIRVTSWLVTAGFTVEFEPLSHGSKTPDLLVTLEEDCFAIECKSFDLDNFFDKEIKQDIANQIYSLVSTCDQLDLFIAEEVECEEIISILSNEKIIRDIHKAGALNEFSDIQLSADLRLVVTQKPPISGNESTNVTADLGMIMEDNTTGIRLPGFAFLKGGRSVGIFGPIPSLRKRLNDKRRQSNKQAISSYPYIVMLDGDKLVGNPEEHQSYFDQSWLTEENNVCSAIGIIRFSTIEGIPKIELFENCRSQCPLTKEVMNVISGI